MLYLYRGWNSGTNQAVLSAWRTGSSEVEIQAYDLDVSLFSGVLAKLRALPCAVRRGGVNALMPGQGRLVDAAKRSAWCMERIAKEVDKLQNADGHSFSLAIGTVTPNLSPKRSHFIYTDLTIRANAYYPEGAERLRLWQECIPYEEESLRKATVVFTMSDHVTRSLIEQYGLPQERVVRVNGGTNSPISECSDVARYSKRNILFVGVQWELKGGPQLVEAFRIVRKRYPGTTLTIVGCTPDVTDPGIEVVGRVPQERIRHYLNSASCFCMVSRREAFGIAYIEAMHAGLPVIASDLGATPDFVLNGETGYRVHHDDVCALAERIGELLCDPGKCQRMGEQAKRLVQSEYTWERTQRKMYHAICNVIKRG
jgi:glycosyltransferase involved in cell wall biosynthesis